MKRYVALGCLGAGLMVSPLLGRFADSAVPANPKIGVVDIERALAETPTGKAATAKFEAIVKAKQADIDAKQQAFGKAVADFKKQQPILTPQAVQQQGSALEQQQQQLQQLAAKSEQDLAGERTKIMTDVLKKATPLIADLAKAQGLTMVLEKSAVIWNDPSVDLTAQLEAKM